MNRFSVNPLGGFNPVQAVTNIKQQNRQQDAQEAQLQADRDKKIAFANAATGNPESMRKLAEVDPNLFQWMDQRNSKRAEVEGAENAAVKQQTEQQWLIRYNQALESEDEQAKQALMQEAISDPNNDLEHGAIGKDPEADKTITKAILFNSMGKDAYSQFYGDGGAGKKLDPTANMQDFSTYQDLKKTDPEAAKRFGQKVGFVTKEGRELSPYHQKQLTKYSDSAVEAESLANEFNVIANDFEKLDPVSGAAGGAYEFLKEATGAEDAVSELKRKYLKIRASQLVKNLPPGAASEKDVQLALSGFPKSTANPETMSSFMRGLARLQQFQADYSNFRSQYLSDNATERGMLKAWKGREVPVLKTDPSKMSDDELFN
jgi:hypothetical protein